MLTNALRRTGILFSWSFVHPATVIQACVLVFLASCYNELTVSWGVGERKKSVSVAIYKARCYQCCKNTSVS